MMTYRSHRYAALCLLLALNLLSSSATASDATAKTLEDYLPSGCHHSGNYLQQKIIPDLAQPLETQGTFIYTCDHGLIWHTQSPIIETAIYKVSGRHFLATEDAAPSPMTGRVHQSLGTLLNHLIGGDASYLQRHFHATAQSEQLQLTPKSKRLKRFIQHILIQPQTDKVTIELHHAGNELTHITIVDRQAHDLLDQALCEQLLPGKAVVCTTLLAD